MLFVDFHNRGNIYTESIALIRRFVKQPNSSMSFFIEKLSEMFHIKGHLCKEWLVNENLSGNYYLMINFDLNVAW